MVNEKVLIVDDDEGVRRVTADILRCLEYEVSTAYDFQSAREVYQEMLQHGGPDMVLTDWEYPGGGGAIFIQYLIDNNYRRPVGIITGNESIGDCIAEKIPKLQKPFGLTDLRNFISHLNTLCW